MQKCTLESGEECKGGRRIPVLTPNSTKLPTVRNFHNPPMISGNISTVIGPGGFCSTLAESPLRFELKTPQNHGIDNNSVIGSNWCQL